MFQPGARDGIDVHPDGGLQPPPHLQQILTGAPLRESGCFSYVPTRNRPRNNSFFDGRDGAIGPADDTAVATDKTFLASGGRPGFTNITSYVKGINGLMIDVGELLTPPTLGDFSFKAPSAFDPSVFVDVPAPSGFAVRDLPGGDHLRRVTFTWPDGLLRNTWLQVGVLATPATHRPAPDLSYVGNLVGETGDGTPGVTARDLLAVRRSLGAGAVPVADPHDLDKDGRVGALDLSAVRRNMGRSLPAPTPPTAVRLTSPPPEEKSSAATRWLTEQ